MITAYFSAIEIDIIESIILQDLDYSRDEMLQDIVDRLVEMYDFEGEMPYLVSKGRSDIDPEEWSLDRAADDLGIII